ncbi:pde-4, partial [Symbiodinium sp. KB8]
MQVLFQKAAQHHNLLEKLEDQSAVKEGLLFRSRLPRFLRTIEETYRSDVPYHTAVHASDAMMTMEWLLRSQSLLGQISAVDHLMVAESKHQWAISEVLLPLSGRSLSVEAELEASVDEFRHRVQESLGVKKGRLLNSTGRALDGHSTLRESGLQSGDMLTWHVGQVQVQASSQAVAALLSDGSVVTWGHADYGGDSSSVQHRLNRVRQVQAGAKSFAAILDDGSVVTWGNPSCGGDSSAVQHHLCSVTHIQASSGAFAAICGDGSVVAWGDPCHGGNCSQVQDQLKNVRQIHSTLRAFAAILADGSVVTWGQKSAGGSSSAVQSQLRCVCQIQSSQRAFAAILEDGSVVTWGNVDYGGCSSAVQGQLKTVQQIQSTSGAFAAILADGSVVTWGARDYGGDSETVQARLKDVRQIQASSAAFAAILGDGCIVTWGCESWGGSSLSVQGQLKDVHCVQASMGAFAAIRCDGSVVVWGSSMFGGICTLVQAQLEDVQCIQASDSSFAAIRGDGSVVTWGDPDYLSWAQPNTGCDSAVVQQQLVDVQFIQASSVSFAAVLGDGSVVTWGDAPNGGDSSAVQALTSMAIHDVGHPGRNNLFHSKSLSPLAISYNDKSILENFHVATAFEIMQKDADMNWLALLSTDFVPPGKEKPSNLQSQMRRGMIEIVLGTDMAKHNQHQKSLMSWMANKPTAETPAGEQAFLQDKLELLEVLAHAADISNPCKPHDMMLFWAERVLSEFWLQGDEESRLNLEFSPMCERAVGECSVPKQQIGFLNFVIAPFYQPLAELLPEVQEAVDHMTDNRAFWQKKETEQ